MLLKFSDWLIYGLLGLSQENHLAGMLHFFIYDTIKILLLLFVMISVIGFLRSFLPQKKVNKWLQDRGISGNIGASIFGAITPFCSCSSIPIFLSFISAGAPLGVTFSFLITSPIINEYLLVLMLGFFGWKITLVYLVSGIFVGVTGGFILGKMKLEKYLEADMMGSNSAEDQLPEFPTFISRIKFGLDESWDIITKIWKWILVGVAIGAAIHNYVPRETIQDIISSTGIFAVPLAVLLGVPMYGSCAAIVPIAVVLFQKGLPLGTALAFMMAIAVLSLPEAILLRRAMKLKLILVFFGTVSLYIIFIGYLLNFLQPILM